MHYKINKIFILVCAYTIFNSCLNAKCKYIQDIHHAAESGCIKKIEQYLKEGVNVNSIDETGRPLLMNAVAADQVETVEFLLLRGADPDQLGDNTAGSFSLGIAAFRGKVRIVNLLLQNGANINVTNKSGLSALELAALGGQLEILKILISQKAELYNSTTGLSVIHSAAVSNNPLVLTEILKYNLDINSTDKEGWTPLLAAVSTGLIENVKILLDAGADVNIKLHDGTTCLQLAKEKGHKEVVKLLSSHKVLK